LFSLKNIILIVDLSIRTGSSGVWFCYGLFRLWRVYLHDCVPRCGDIEIGRHLFLSCSAFGSLWALVRSWIDFSAVDAYSLTDHFIHFTYSAGGLRARQSFLQLVWLACVWIVWNERNLRVFRNSENTVHQLLDKVNLFSYRWLRTTDITLTTNFHRWWSSPLLCLGID
jgi:hypothetical protein